MKHTKSDLNLNLNFTPRKATQTAISRLGNIEAVPFPFHKDFTMVRMAAKVTHIKQRMFANVAPVGKFR